MDKLHLGYSRYVFPAKCSVAHAGDLAKHTTKRWAGTIRKNSFAG